VGDHTSHAVSEHNVTLAGRVAIRGIERLRIVSRISLDGAALLEQELPWIVTTGSWSCMLRAILEGSAGGNSLVKQITIVRCPHLYRMTFRYRERGRLRIGKRLNCDEVNSLRRSGFFDERARLKLGVTDKKHHLANRSTLLAGPNCLGCPEGPERLLPAEDRIRAHPSSLHSNAPIHRRN
jgi:hypothetical protein